MPFRYHRFASGEQEPPYPGQFQKPGSYLRTPTVDHSGEGMKAVTCNSALVVLILCNEALTD